VSGAADVRSVEVEPGLLDRVRRRLAADGVVPTTSHVAAALRRESGALHGDAALLGVLRALQSEIVGAGPLEPLLRDPDVTDVLVNAPDEVWVDRGSGLERSAVRFADDLAVRRLAQRLVAPTCRRLDDAQPWVDARLADGTRLHAVLSPIATRPPACRSGWSVGRPSASPSWSRRAPCQQPAPKSCGPSWRPGSPSW